MKTVFKVQISGEELKQRYKTSAAKLLQVFILTEGRKLSTEIHTAMETANWLTWKVRQIVSSHNKALRNLVLLVLVCSSLCSIFEKLIAWPDKFVQT